MSPRDAAIDARRARPLSDAARSADGTGRMSSPSSVSPRSGPISLTTDVRRTDSSDNFKQSENSQDSYEETVTILLQELQSSSIVQALM